MSSLALEGICLHKLRCILCPCCHCRGLVYTCSHTFCVLARMGAVWSTHIAMDFLPSLTWEGFVNQCWDSFCVLTGIRWFWSTHVEVHFVSSLALRMALVKKWWMNLVSSLSLNAIGEHKMRYVMCPRCHWMGFAQPNQRYILWFIETQFLFSLVNTSWYAFCVLAVLGGVWSKHVEMYFVSSLAWKVFSHTCWEIFCVIDGLEWVWSTEVVIHFVSSKTWELFWLHELCPSCHGTSLFNTCWGAFCVLPAWDEFGPHMLRCILSLGLGQHMLRCILCPGWNGRSLLKTCWDATSFLAGVCWVWSTQVDMSFVWSLAWDCSVNKCWVACCVLDGVGLMLR